MSEYVVCAFCIFPTYTVQLMPTERMCKMSFENAYHILYQHLTDVHQFDIVTVLLTSHTLYELFMQNCIVCFIISLSTDETLLPVS